MASSTVGSSSFLDNLVVVIGILKRMPKGSRLKRLSGSVLPRLRDVARGFPLAAGPVLEREKIVHRTEPAPCSDAVGMAIRWFGVLARPIRARSRALDSGGQARKGAWGMTRHQEAVKGAEDCDKPGVTVKQVMIPGCPNELQLNS